jgi:hypothetical protein
MRSPVALVAIALASTASAAEPAPAPRATRDLQFTVRAVTMRDGAKAPPDVRFFSEAELTAFLTAAQNDPLATVTTYPRLTVRGTQRAEVCVLEKQSFATGLDVVNVNGTAVFVPRNVETELGIRCDVWGRASADARAVELNFAHSERKVVGEVPLVPIVKQITPVLENGKKGKPVPFTQYLQLPTIETVSVQRTELRVPSGGHAVVAGPAFEREVRTEFQSKIPYLNRLFTNVGNGREQVRTFFVVSPVVLGESAP